MERCRLELIGITYNQIESGVYAVILQEAGGTRRIPIIIGFPEAQSIECKLQEVVTPRPLTHDLMVTQMASFGISLKEVNIYKMDNGVFAAELHLVSEDRERVIDSRSSDAIALAIRVGAPIYTTREVLDESGFEPKEATHAKAAGPKAPEPPAVGEGSDELWKKTDSELIDAMMRAAESEQYELAARIKAELDRRETK